VRRGWALELDISLIYHEKRKRRSYTAFHVKNVFFLKQKGPAYYFRISLAGPSGLDYFILIYVSLHNSSTLLAHILT
jgi:hypothetical protein